MGTRQNRSWTFEVRDTHHGLGPVCLRNKAVTICGSVSLELHDCTKPVLLCADDNYAVTNCAT